MYKYLLRTVYAARKSSVSVNESLALLAKCDKAAAPVLRIANVSGVRALSTSSIRLCEKKPDSASSNQDGKTNADKEEHPTEPPTLVAQSAEEDSNIIKVAEQSEDLVVLKTDDGSSTQQQVDVKTEQVVVTPEEVKSSAVKSGKEGLLELLGAMKVDVTSKRKLKLKVEKSSESAPVSTPADMKSTISMFQKAKEDTSSLRETLDPELVAAASAAASTLPNRSQAESELLRQLRQHETVTEAQKKGDIRNIGTIIADMKVGKNAKRQNVWPANQIQYDDDGRGYTHDTDLDDVRRRKNLLSGKRLNIFPHTMADKGAESAVARPTLWDMDFAHQLSSLTNHMPRNRLDEMIQWTKEGKMWQYPINNEAGLEEEASVSFHEHIFLEKHLEDFPRQGPVRHFMELVVTGLSKNPYLTVQQKKEHIAWFRDYFHQKEEVLKEAYVNLS